MDDTHRRQKAFAWAKYYESLRNRLVADHRHVTRVQELLKEQSSTIPQHILDSFIEMAAELKKTWECPICITMIGSQDLEVTSCGHFYCKGCLVALKVHAKAANMTHAPCPVCRRKIPV